MSDFLIATGWTLLIAIPLLAMAGWDLAVILAAAFSVVAFLAAWRMRDGTVAR